MNINFILGKAKSGKTQYCIEQIKSKLQENDMSSLILLVPEFSTFESEKRFLQEIQNDKFLRSRVLSFKSLSNLIFTEVSGLTRNQMKSGGRSMLIYRIMNELKDELKIFSKSAKQQGFVKNVSDLIKELKKFDVDIEKLNSINDEIEDTLLKSKICDIKNIYEKFEEKIENKFIDFEDELNILSNKIGESDYLKNANIYIDGFSGFTPVQYKVIMSLMNVCSSINITLETDLNFEQIDESDVFVSAKITKQKIENICKNQNIYDLNYIKLSNEKSYESLEIKHLESNYFSYPYKTYDKKTKDINIFKSINVYSEVEEVAKAIVHRIRNENLRYSDIVVCTRDINKYSNLVSAIFNEYEIPYFLDEKKELKSNSIIVLISAALEIYNKKYSYESVFRYLKTNLLNIDKNDIYMLENYVLANGIKGKTKWLSEWEYRLNYNFSQISDSERETIARINEIRKQIVEPLQKFFNKVKSKQSVVHICESLYLYLKDIGLEDKLQDLIVDMKNNNELTLANEYSQVFDIFVDVLEQMIEISKDDQMTLDEFSKVLNVGFEEYEIGVIPSHLDQVQVSSVERLANMHIKHLYLMGVNDGAFPLASIEDGVLNDKDREILKGHSIELDLDSVGKTYQEQFFIYLALSSPINSLNISYSIGDSEGKTLRQSIIISRIKKIFPNISIKSNVLKSNEAMQDIVSKVPAFNNLIINLKKWDMKDEINPEWIDVYRWFVKDDVYMPKLKNMVNALDYTNQVQQIEEEKIRNLYNKNYFSVSRLEKYAQCPFAYFVQYGLKAKERRMYSFTAPDMGSFMHNVLDEFCTYLKEKNITWADVNDEFIDMAVNHIVDDMINKIPGFILNSSSRYKYLSIRLKRVLSRTLQTITYQINEGDFIPDGYEVGFGPNEQYPPIKIELSNGEKINLIGRIDRLDVFEDNDKKYIRIVDYKSSDKDLNLSDIYNGLSMQLLIYLDAILKSAQVSGKSISPAAMLYFRIDDPIIKEKEDIDDDKVKIEILKKMKMKGYILNDKDIINHMDNNINSKKGNSDVIPAVLTKDGVGKRTKGLTSEEFSMLRKYVNETIKNLSTDMLSGNISINPCKEDKKTSCDYCKFSPICQFDEKMKDNNYKAINKLSDKDIWTSIKEKVRKND